MILIRMADLLKHTMLIYKIIKIIIPVLLIHYNLAAQKSGELKGLYGSMNLGIGIVSGNITGEEINTSANFAMHFNIGFFICRSMQAGITLNGWLFEPYGPFLFTYYEGESISSWMFHLQFYPLKNSRLFFKGAYGISEYINLTPEKDQGKGDAFMVALGYEKKLGKDMILAGIQLSYSIGKLKYTDLYGTNNLANRKFSTIDLTLLLAID
jgi:hypothetical protein